MRVFRLFFVIFVMFIALSGVVYATDYAEFVNYPDSTVTIASYPYQFVGEGSSGPRLFYSATPFWLNGTSLNNESGTLYARYLSGDTWGASSSYSTATVCTDVYESHGDIYDGSGSTVLYPDGYGMQVYYQSDSNAFNLKAEKLVQEDGYRVYLVEHVVDGTLKASTKLAVPGTYSSVLSLYSVSGDFVEVSHTGITSIFYYDTPDMRDDQYGSMDLSADYDIYSFPNGEIPSFHSEQEITNLYKMYVVDSSSDLNYIDSQGRDLGSNWNLIYNPDTYGGVERWGVSVDLTDESILSAQMFIDNLHIGNDVAWTYVSDTLTVESGHVQGIVWFDYLIWLNQQYDLELKYRDMLYDVVTINSISTTGETQSTTGTTGIEVDDFDLSDWLLHPIELMTSIFRNLAGQAMGLVELLVPAHIFPPEFTALLMLAVVSSLLLVILGRR